MQQQTPFSKVKSPESPKAQEGASDGGEGGAGLRRDEFLTLFAFQTDRVSSSHAARGQVAQRGEFPPRRNPSVSLIFRPMLALTI